MWDFSVGRTLAVLLRSWPFLILRLAIYVAAALGYVAAIAAGAAAGYGIGGVWSDPSAPAIGAAAGGVLGFGLVSIVLFWLREYLLYVVKAGHIAVIVHLLEGRPVPGGLGQFAYARRVVAARFAETNALFLLDQLIRGVVTAISGLLLGVASVLPIPGLRELARFAGAVMRVSLNSADEVVLARNVATEGAQPYDDARDGLVLFAQNGTRMLRNGLWLTLIQWVLTLAIFAALLAPAGVLAYEMSGAIGGTGIVVALLAAWAVKAAILDPFVVCALMQAYFAAIRGQQPDAGWVARLDDASRSFRELAEHAGTAFGGRPASGRQVDPGTI